MKSSMLFWKTKFCTPSTCQEIPFPSVNAYVSTCHMYLPIYADMLWILVAIDPWSCQTVRRWTSRCCWNQATSFLQRCQLGWHAGKTCSTSILPHHHWSSWHLQLWWRIYPRKTSTDTHQLEPYPRRTARVPDILLRCRVGYCWCYSAKMVACNVKANDMIHSYFFKKDKYFIIL